MEPKAPLIPPTVGRIVWFYIHVPGQGHKGPLAAIISKVHNGVFVNVSYFTEDGVSQPASSIPLVQVDETIPESDYATWMPYQVGQAQKTEKLQKELAEAKG